MFQPAIGRIETIRPIAPVPAGAIDLNRIISALWRGRVIIVLATSVALATALLFALTVRPQYVATTELLIDPGDLHVVANELTMSNQTNDAAVLQVESQARVLTSDNVLRRVIAALKLDRDPEFARGPSALRLWTNGLLSAIGIERARQNDDPVALALNELQRHVRVRRAERTYVVDVTASSDAAEKSARIANAIAEAYLAEQTSARAETARRVSGSLSARLSELKDRVREAEERVEAFKSQNNMVAAGGELVSERKLQELNTQLGVAHAQTAEAKSRYEQVERAQKSDADGGAFTEAVQSQTMTSLRAQFAEVMRREADQTTTLGPRHPALFATQAEAQRLRHLIAEEIGRIAEATRNDYERARANEEALARNLEALKNEAQTTSQALVTLRELQREVQASRSLYESFLARSQETGEQERLDTNNIRVISTADLPLGRNWPPSNTVMALGAVLVGMAGGAAWVLLQALRAGGSSPGGTSREKIAVPAQVAAVSPGRAQIREASAGFPLLGVLPTGLSTPSAKEGGNSRFAADMRNFLATLRASQTEPATLTILVVPSQEEADTTNVALQLASCVAAAERVLLVDADVHERTRSAIMPGESDAGLVDVALGRKSLPEAVIHDQRSNISLMPLVSPKSHRIGQMKDSDIKAAFDQTNCFDVVIVAAGDHDGDPAVRFFAGLVDHVVLVAAAGQSGPDNVERLISRLAIDARKIRGTILTGAKARA